MAHVTRDWPALMSLEVACDYLALAPGSLVSLLRRENVPPVQLGARLRRWRRRDLDDLVARLPVSSTARERQANPQAIEDVERALAAVERRSCLRRKFTKPRRAHEVRPSHPAP